MHPRDQHRHGDGKFKKPAGAKGFKERVVPLAAWVNARVPKQPPPSDPPTEKPT